MKEKIKKNRSVVRLYLWTKRCVERFYFVGDYIRFKNNLSVNRGFTMSWSDRGLSLGDRTSTTSFDAHYTYHPAWAARILAATKPSVHTDISSILSFSAIVSAFQPIEFYDYRPAHIILSNLKTGQADLCRLSFKNDSIISLSCMHTLEHVGLGRYGDPIDPDADMTAASELSRVLARGGNLLIVTPVGKPRIVFNSHRIYSYDQIVSLFRGLELKEFSLIPDNALEHGMILNATRENVAAQTYGCGCFWFIKK